MEQQTLFGLPDYMAQPIRNHDGKFAPRCDGEPQKKVKEHLLSGLSITVQQCFRLYHTTELRRIISRLKKQGMDISDRWCSDTQGRRYKSYLLKHDKSR